MEPQADRAQGAQFDITLRRVRIIQFLADRVELSARAEVRPSEAAVLERLRFSGMRVDGKTPVYLESLEGQYALQRNVPLVLPPVRMALYYSDFPSPSSMQAILDARSMHVSGSLRAGLRLSLLGKLAVRDMHPVTALVLDQDVPLDHDAVDAPTQLGVGILSIAQSVLGTSATILDRVAGVRITSDDGVPSERQTRPMVVIRTSYRIGGKGGSETKTCMRLGFWIDDRHALVPAEALEPWAYSLESAEAMAMGSKMDEGSVETVLLPVRPGGGYDDRGRVMTKADFRVLRRGTPERSHLVMPSGASVSVVERESQQNYAILEFAQGAGMPVARSAYASDHTQALRRDESRGSAVRTVDLGRAVERGSALMPRPIDELAFGSPLLLDSDAVGMIVGEREVISLSSLPTY